MLIEYLYRPFHHTCWFFFCATLFFQRLALTGETHLDGIAWFYGFDLGHPLGMSGARLALAASHELHRRNGRYALCTMCIGVGQGIAMILERV